MNCSVCGSKCSVTKRHIGYDPKTGERTYELHFKCPKYSFPFKTNHENSYMGAYQGAGGIKESELKEYGA